MGVFIERNLVFQLGRRNERIKFFHTNVVSLFHAGFPFDSKDGVCPSDIHKKKEPQAIAPAALALSYFSRFQQVTGAPRQK